MGFEYTVNSNDKGLTYIFLEQAKKQQGFDASKKIDWNKVLTVFDQIQKEEEAEGQKLFSGGTDKTRSGWGKSYIIKAGDKINLSDEQLNKIYGAMGLDLSKVNNTPVQTPAPTQPAKPTQPPAQTPAPAPTQKKEQPPAKVNPQAADPNPPKADPNKPKASDPSDIPAQKAPLDANEGIRHSKYANQSVLNQDGTTSSYDEEGYLEKIMDKNGNVTKEISREYNSIIEYEYDKDGNNNRMIIRNIDGTLDSYYKYEYGKDGNKTKEVRYNPDGSIIDYSKYEYDKDGNKTKEIIYNPDGSITGWYYKYERDKDGHCSKMLRYNADGSVDYWTDYEYDQNGNNTREVEYHGDGTLYKYIDYEYDENGNQISYQYHFADKNGKVIEE